MRVLIFLVMMACVAQGGEILVKIIQEINIGKCGYGCSRCVEDGADANNSLAAAQAKLTQLNEQKDNLENQKNEVEAASGSVNNAGDATSNLTNAAEGNSTDRRRRRSTFSVTSCEDSSQTLEGNSTFLILQVLNGIISAIEDIQGGDYDTTKLNCYIAVASTLTQSLNSGALEKPEDLSSILEVADSVKSAANETNQGLEATITQLDEQITQLEEEIVEQEAEVVSNGGTVEVTDAPTTESQTSSPHQITTMIGITSDPPVIQTQSSQASTTQNPNSQSPTTNPSTSMPTTRPTTTQTGTQPTASQTGTQPTATQTGTHPTNTQNGTQPSASQTGTQPTATQTGTQPTATQTGTQSTATQTGTQPTTTQTGTQPTTNQTTTRPPTTQTTTKPTTTQTTTRPTTTQTPRPTTTQTTTRPTTTQTTTRPTTTQTTTRPTTTQTTTRPTTTQTTTRPTTTQTTTRPTTTQTTTRPTTTQTSAQQPTTTTEPPCDYSQFGNTHTMQLPPESTCITHLTGVTEADKSLILATHNNFRAQVARGNETRGNPGPQPAGANLRELVWNNQLAEVAQAWAQQCPNGHDSYSDRRICSRSYAVGQNIYYYWGFVASTSWAAAITAWYEEVVHMPNTGIGSFAGGSFNGQVIGHYTQVVWAETYEVGCGGIHYNTTLNGVIFPESKIYVCNYGPAGNFLNQPIYTEGSAASQCSNGASTTYPDLCA